jgi:hypothetical protein
VLRLGNELREVDRPKASDSIFEHDDAAFRAPAQRIMNGAKDPELPDPIDQCKLLDVTPALELAFARNRFLLVLIALKKGDTTDRSPAV